MAEITMSAKAQKIMQRYQQRYVTDTQLEKYLQLNVITEAEYSLIAEGERSETTGNEAQEALDEVFNVLYGEEAP